MARIALNGLGRVGRTFLKLALDRNDLDVVAVNDIADPDHLVYLMRYDSVYGRYDRHVSIERAGATTWLNVGSRALRLLSERRPEALPWRELGVDVVVEATGAFESYAAAARHLEAGAAHVVLSSPAKDEDTDDQRTVLMGVNAADLKHARISSNGSCTTNSAAGVIEVLHERIGIRKAMLNTVHAYTATQHLVDEPSRGKDFRRGRAAAVNIVPSTTGAAVAVTRAIPALRERFDGIAMRVPIVAGSLSSMVALMARSTTADEVNQLLRDASLERRWAGILATSDDPLVSSDIVGEPHAAIVDLSLTKVVDGDLCSVYSWYDNEFGFANTLLAHVVEAAALHSSGELAGTTPSAAAGGSARS